MDFFARITYVILVWWERKPRTVRRQKGACIYWTGSWDSLAATRKSSECFQPRRCCLVCVTLWTIGMMIRNGMKFHCPWVRCNCGFLAFPIVLFAAPKWEPLWFSAFPASAPVGGSISLFYGTGAVPWASTVGREMKIRSQTFPPPSWG